MATAAERESQFASMHAETSTTVAGVKVYRDMAAAEAVWRGLENACHLHTPYQRFDFLKAWQDNAGSHDKVTPLIVVAEDATSRPLLMLPLGIVREHGINIARFLGGKHTTFNMGLWRRDFASSVTKADIDTIFRQITSQGVDALALTQQPRQWSNISNPMLLFTNQPSPNSCPTLRMRPDARPEEIINGGFRRKMRGKERKLQTLPGYRYYLAETDEDISRVLDAFFAIKPLRMAAQNLPNVFANPGIAQFLRQACHAKLPSGGRAITIHALECDDEVIAMFAGVASGDRFSTMFNTYTMSDNAKYSPGVILIRDMIDHYKAKNYTSFDLGIGSDDYKQQFCKDDEPIFDSFIPLSARGSVVTLGLSAMTYAKRFVKTNAALKQAANRLRGRMIKA
jgi:CelD/BcsL family acetyltransferase involved in cellulose biosynthesis